MAVGGGLEGNEGGDGLSREMTDVFLFFGALGADEWVIASLLLFPAFGDPFTELLPFSVSADQK